MPFQPPADLTITDADHETQDIASFTCGDADLEDFIKTECIAWGQQRLSVTKIALLDTAVVGYIALAADSIPLELKERGWLPSGVTTQHIPALKVGRLAVHSGHRDADIGTALMRYALGVAFRLSTDLHVGCRCLTVDAYPASVKFYEKLGFVKSEHRWFKKRTNAAMYYDIVGGQPF
ncbi:Acetyltransferase (GNAT) domain protein [uncultured archaeon]|nr:Acetyltransferase (GNAT) domain protein [uncultured archaeon]